MEAQRSEEKESSLGVLVKRQRRPGQPLRGPSRDQGARVEERGAACRARECRETMWRGWEVMPWCARAGAERWRRSGRGEEGRVPRLSRMMSASRGMTPLDDGEVTWKAEGGLESVRRAVEGARGGRVAV